MSKELSTLVKLGEELYAAEAEVLRLDAELAKAKARRDTIQNDIIPQAMEEIGVKEFRTENSHVVIKPILAVTPKKDDRPLVFKAVEETGDGAIIKDTVTMALGKGKVEVAKKLLKIAEELQLDAKQERKIEAQTLKKYVKDRLEAGEAVDMKLFGVKQFKQAKFKSGAPEAPVFEDE